MGIVRLVGRGRAGSPGSLGRGRSSPWSRTCGYDDVECGLGVVDCSVRTQSAFRRAKLACGKTVNVSAPGAKRGTCRAEERCDAFGQG